MLELSLLGLPSFYAVVEQICVYLIKLKVRFLRPTKHSFVEAQSEA
jgi:hypothetical protein